MEIIYNILRRESVKALLSRLVAKQLIKSAGFQIWLTTLLLEKAFNVFVIPFAKLLVRNGLFEYDKLQGRIKVKQFKKAKDNQDENNYNDLVDNA